MGLSLTLFTNGTVISATDLMSRIEDIETFVNQGIVQTDLTDSEWVDSHHIYKPEFRGSPDHRVNAVSADTHYRYWPHDKFNRSIHHKDVNDEAWVSVKGMSAPIKVPTDGQFRCTVYACFYTFEAGGGIVDASNARENTLAAEMGLFFDSGTTPITGTVRPIYASCDLNRFVARKNHSWVIDLDIATITAGTHNIGAKVKVSGTAILALLTDVKHVWVDGRSFIVDVQAR